MTSNATPELNLYLLPGMSADFPVMDWQGPRDGHNIRTLHIHGDADTTFPVRYVTPDVVVATGSHALPISHPQEVAAAIKTFMEAA